MQDITYLQSLELIDLAAKENRLYHYNGGQAYIRVNIKSNVLMIIDHSHNDKSEITLHDGTAYFIECFNYNIEHSRRVREYGSIAKWYTETNEKINKIDSALHEIGMI